MILDIIIAAVFMTIIVCSCVCCLLIYAIITLKNTTKQIIKHQSRPRGSPPPLQLKSESIPSNINSIARSNTFKSLKPGRNNDDICTAEIPHFSNPGSESCTNSIRESKIGIHDKMISQDWKLTMNDLHRLTISQQHQITRSPPLKLPIQSDTNQASPIPLPVTPIPREVHEIELDEDEKENQQDGDEDEEEETIGDEFPETTVVEHGNHGTINTIIPKTNESITVTSEKRKRKRNHNKNDGNNNNDTMIENSVSEDSDQPWRYFSVRFCFMYNNNDNKYELVCYYLYIQKYFEHSESKHSSEEKQDRPPYDKINHENDESEELEVVIENENESTITKTIDHENMNIILGSNMNGNNRSIITSSKLDKLSVVNNINTMTNIGGMNEFQIESLINSIQTNDDINDGELMVLQKKYSSNYGGFSKSNTIYMSSMNRQPTTESDCGETDDNDNKYQNDSMMIIHPIIDLDENINNNQQNNNIASYV